jgi:hypothetical protein
MEYIQLQYYSPLFPTLECCRVRQAPADGRAALAPGRRAARARLCRRAARQGREARGAAEQGGPHARRRVPRGPRRPAAVQPVRDVLLRARRAREASLGRARAHGSREGAQLHAWVI